MQSGAIRGSRDEIPGPGDPYKCQTPSAFTAEDKLLLDVTPSRQAANARINVTRLNRAKLTNIVTHALLRLLFHNSQLTSNRLAAGPGSHPERNPQIQ